MSDSTPAVQFAQSPAEISAPEDRLAPFEWYREMRESSPVRYDDDRNTWDVFRYDDVESVLLDTDTFSSDFAGTVERPGMDEDQPLANTMISADPPEHDRLRGVADEWFQPGAIRDRRANVESVARDVLADLPDEGTFDLVADFAYPLPVLVIAELLGVPTERRDQFKAWSDIVVASPEDTSREGLREFQQERERAQSEMAAFFRDLLAERREDPADDLVSQVAHDDSLTETEKVGFCILLLVAGNITTTNLITNAVWCFAEHDLLEDVREGTVERRAAIEEALRYRSPVQSITRAATEPTEIADAEIEPGDRVTVWTGAANRDPAAFDAPAEFRPERSPNRHMAFGKGIHHCLGAPLARAEADIALELLLDAYPDLAVADGPKRPVQSRIVYGLESLDVTV